MSAASPASGAPSRRCELKAPAALSAGQPVALNFTLANRGPAGLQVLAWGTPFEGWFAPFVAVWRNGAELPYRGPKVKRAEPERGNTTYPMARASWYFLNSGNSMIGTSASARPINKMKRRGDDDLVGIDGDAAQIRRFAQRS